MILLFFYKTGTNVSKDYEKALFFGKRAIMTNHPTSIHTFAQMYYYGQGVDQDKEYALEQYQKALSLGGYAQLLSIARYYIDRAYSKEDLIERMKWLEIYSIWSKKYNTAPKKIFIDSYAEVKEKLTLSDIDKAVVLASEWFAQNGHKLLSPSSMLKKCFD